MVTALLYEIILMVLFSIIGDTLPSWAKAIWVVALVVTYLIAYSSYCGLQDKVKCLENEVEKIKKGGAE